MSPSPAARDAASRMADAARSWLDALDDARWSRAAWEWPSDAERHRWNYRPVDHGGLTLQDMTPGQQQLALRLVATGLSRAGFVTVSTIMGLENVLDRLEGWRSDRTRDRGRDPQRYFLRVFGEPGGDAPWSWRFGGHHVSLHLLVVDGAMQAGTPCFLGADPADSPLLGPHPLRPLAGAEDLARDLVRSLDDAQSMRALLRGAVPSDIVTGTQVRVSASPDGIAARDLGPAQQERLRALLDVYIGRIPEELAEQEAAKFAGERLGDVHLAWAGETEPGRAHYYRLQGPRLLAEYDNTQRDAKHIHTVWRDPDGDFGFDILAEHRALHH